VGCHRCGGEESNDHLLQCHRKQAAQIQTVAKFRKYLDTLKTVPTVANALSHGLENWISSGTANSQVAERGEAIEKACLKQDHIGWGKAMRGLLAKEWKDMCYGVTQDSENHRGAGWASLVSLWLVRESKLYWTTRNEEREASANGVTDKSSALVEAELAVKNLYDRHLELAESDRGNLAVPMARRLQLSLRQMLAWISVTREAVNKMAHEQRLCLERQQPDIVQALQTVVTLEAATETRTRMQRRIERRTARANQEPIRGRAVAVEMAVLRATRPRQDMMERLIMGQREALKVKKAKAQAKAYKEAKTKEIAEKSPKRKGGKNYKVSKAREAHQNKIHPNTQAMVDKIRRGRLPKFRKVAVGGSDPQADHSQPNPQSNWSLSNT
jgi:hypothetical protein